MMVDTDKFAGTTSSLQLLYMFLVTSTPGFELFSNTVEVKRLGSSLKTMASLASQFLPGSIGSQDITVSYASQVSAF